MQDSTYAKKVRQSIKEHSITPASNCKEIAIILAAGHGKRIKSKRSKMLHSIWKRSTVERVHGACKEGLNKAHIHVVVGIKAVDVIESIGKRPHTSYVYQKEQNGTGDALRIALSKIGDCDPAAVTYVFPGDMGLLDDNTVRMFKRRFIHSKHDMIVLTGLYEGKIEDNYYGRILRVKSHDCSSNSSKEDFGKVIEILEYQDILGLDDKKAYQTIYKGKTYHYTKKELLENREFNSGVYAYKLAPLKKIIKNLRGENVQNEVYITDLIGLFNQKKLSVGAVSPSDQTVLMGFNNKSVLQKMKSLARTRVYDKLKDIIDIKDPEDFFIDETVIKDILLLDKKGFPLDIKIGKGVYIGRGVKLNYNLNLMKNIHVEGNVVFGKNVSVWENVHLSCFPNQKFLIGDNVEILLGDILKGNIQIGINTKIESGVNMTGNDEHPLRIGKNVHIKGVSYLFGSIVEDDVFIERSVLIKKKVEKLIKRDGTIQPIRFVLPMPEGVDAIEELE